ncbi:MAG: hypothetical protein M1814_002166 [Vezdaea aestivalis]|nr:MAG: hypothetical protein M1814_002166 [Vezdaea aestivalis]
MDVILDIPKRHDDRIILHFDYDCFYAAVVEAERPEIKEMSLPLAVQQKQIIVTCNYEARRRGLKKLQLISEAKRICPDLIIVLGEDLTRFRDASKKLYGFLQQFTWNRRAERLGFDEVFLDVTEVINENLKLLNSNNLRSSFFHLSQKDPLEGFTYDAATICGHTYYPEQGKAPNLLDDLLLQRLIIGSHLAQHIRCSLESSHGYTATAGVSTSKLLSKLVGNVNKPNGQTTLLPPYTGLEPALCVPARFLAAFDIGSVPGIGFKTSHKLRKHVLQTEPKYDESLIYGGTLESVSVRDVRDSPGMGVKLLSQILGGHGSSHNIGGRVWNLLWGVDNSNVTETRSVPRQISIEDSYLRLDNEMQVKQEFRTLATSLLRRMHTDLLEEHDNGLLEAGPDGPQKRWIAWPRSIRLSTRPRPPVGPDGTRARSFARISRSAPLPSFMLNLSTPAKDIVERLILEIIWPMFKRLHPEKQGWDLSLVNLGVTNMDEGAVNATDSRVDIGTLLRRQEGVGKEWRVEDKDVPPDFTDEPLVPSKGVNEGCMVKDEAEHQDFEAVPGKLGIPLVNAVTEDDNDSDWEFSDANTNLSTATPCPVCGSFIPIFAAAAHERFHVFGDG